MESSRTIVSVSRTSVILISPEIYKWIKTEPSLVLKKTVSNEISPTNLFKLLKIIKKLICRYLVYRFEQLKIN